jgi:acetyltransferase
VSIRNLEHAVHPRSLAVFGASDREGSVGRVVIRNILDAGFAGEVWPVNPKHAQVSGRSCYRNAAVLPGAPDLGVIVTPPQTVPEIISDLGRLGTRAAVVITAGLTAENGLRQAMLDAARPFLFRIIGPNTLGLIIPPAKLNASFAHQTIEAGGLALLTQSGAIAGAMIDWAAGRDIGFSHIVSLGDMADVDAGDYLDMLAGDATTRAILLYLESIPSPRKFMSAARAAARLKPVIAIKSGRHAEAAKAAATHTGALSGTDRVVDAALRRAGILRVHDLDELFDAAEITARFAPLSRDCIGIVTNGGGAGVLAVDRLLDFGGTLAALSPQTIETLDGSLPTNWSRANPVDIIGDADAGRYQVAVAAVAADPQTDALLVLNCPTGLASALESAKAVAALAQEGKIDGKPILACWLGDSTARQGRAVLHQAGLASFETPADAARAIAHLAGWARAQQALQRVPANRSEDVKGERETVSTILRQAAGEGRRMLTEVEAKAVLAAYGIAVPETLVATTPEAVEQAASGLLRHSRKIVVKLHSRVITHKSDLGGVILDIETPGAARDAAETIAGRLHAAGMHKALDGFAVQPMIVRRHAHELIIGIGRDPIFGPVVLFGAGGTAVEVMDDTAVALPPLDDVLAGDLIDGTRIGRLLAGYRDRPPADRGAILHALNAVSQLIVDFSCIEAMDINPLLADADSVIALDARIEIAPERLDRPAPNPDLAIRPYPAEWTSEVTLAGRRYVLRPIRPADVELYPGFLERISPQDIRFRFLAPRRHFPDAMLRRLTQLDYDRDMAFVAVAADTGELAGIGRLSTTPDKNAAEFALLVRTDLQGQGLGWTLLRQLIDYARVEGIGRIEGAVLSDNLRMLEMCREFGFVISPDPDEPAVCLVSLGLGLAEGPS